MREIRNVVLSGGSSKGLEYIGVYEYMRERNLHKHIIKFAGVSIGAVFAMLWFFEFTPEQMSRVFGYLDWRRRHRLRKTLEQLPDVITRFGLDPGDGFLELFDFALFKKTGRRNITFAELGSLYPGRHLYVGMANLSKTKYVLAGADTTPDLPVSLAIRISISLPVFFEPVEWNGDVWADGGVINNMPIELFDDDIEHTLAFDFICREELEMPVNSISSLTLKHLLGLMDGTNNYKRKLFADNLCVLTASHKVALTERRIEDVFDYFEFNFTPGVIASYRRIGYNDAHVYFNSRLTADSDWSLEAVLLHLIWKTIRRMP